MDFTYQDAPRMSKVTPAVKAIAQIDITGNVTPGSWYRLIRIESKGGRKSKPYLIAISLLADIVYWHKPVKVMDKTGKVIGYRRKFESEKFRVNYTSYQELFDIGRMTIYRALAHLRDRGWIKLDVETTNTKGKRYGSITYATPIAEKIRWSVREEITPTEELGNTENTEITKLQPRSHRDNNLEQISGDLRANNPTFLSKKVDFLEILSKTTKTTKTTKSSKSESPRNSLYDSLASLCVLDPELNGKEIATVADRLAKVNATPKQITTFKVWWESDEWRMSHTPTPTLEQVVKRWTQAMKNIQPPKFDKASFNGNGKSSHPNTRMTRHGIEVWVGEAKES